VKIKLENIWKENLFKSEEAKEGKASKKVFLKKEM